MSDVNANIGIDIDASGAISQLKSLQRQISQFHTSIAKSSEGAALAQRSLQKNLINSINAIGDFSAELRTVRTTAESFTNSLEKNKFSMREYFRYAGASTKTFGTLFRSEFDTISKVAEDRVKRMQTQYIKMGRDASGAMKAIAVIPNELDMSNLNTQMQMAAQRQALFNQLVKQGSTNLLNFGKNTQWAGRQLMVGFTIPLISLGSAASKTFMDMEAAAIKFKKVYGDLFTPQEETQAALDAIQDLGRSFTQYGIAVADTVAIGAEAAAAGFKGLDLQRQTSAATKLSILGQISQQKALETTISLQSALQMSSEDLASSIDFLNAVENQTVVTLDDITTAIPKVAPVIQQLGGDVKDLAFFMAALREGGVNASEGANALKSGLGSLINPTAKASSMLMDMGVNIEKIVEENKGNLRATVVEFARALDTLDPLARARAIEQLFGKFQFARISTLFDNVTREGNQASRVLQLAGTSVEELAALSEQELGITAESSMNKFRKAVEDMKFALMPVGEEFLKAATPIIEFFTRILEKFDGMSEGTKRVITILTIAIGAIGPVALMTFGLLANGLANIIKLGLTLRNGYLKLTGQSKILGDSTQYLTIEQIDAAAAAASLDQAHSNLTQQFVVENEALKRLIVTYKNALRASSDFAAANPGMMIPRRGPKGFAGGGIVRGPGTGKSDSIFAMLSNGEAVIPAESVARNPEAVSALISGNIPGFNEGRMPITIGGRNIDTSGISQLQSSVILRRIENISDLTDTELNQLADIIERFVGSVGAKASELDAMLKESGSPAIAGKAKTYSTSSYNAKAAGERRSVQAQLVQDRPQTGAQEFERAQMIASAAATAMEEAGVSAGRVADAGQVVRGHIVTFSDNAIKTASPLSFSADIWDTISQAENQLSNILSRSSEESEVIRNLYLEELDSLEIQQSAKEELERKIRNNMALSEDEYQIQSQILQRMQAKAQDNADYAKNLTNAFKEYSIGVVAAADVRAISPMEGAYRTPEEITRGRGAALIEAVRRGQGGALSSEEITFLVQHFEREYASAIAEAGRMASPSREVRLRGEQTVDGFIDAVESKIDDARVAGQQISSAVVDGASQSAAQESAFPRRGRRATRPQGPSQYETIPGFGTSVRIPEGTKTLPIVPSENQLAQRDIKRIAAETEKGGQTLSKSISKVSKAFSGFSPGLTSASFGLSAFSGMLMMTTDDSNSKFAKFNENLFKASNALMAFSMISSAIPGGAGGLGGRIAARFKSARLAGGQAAIAASYGRGVGGISGRVATMGSKLPGTLGKLVPAFGRLLVGVSRFLGPWGMAIGVIAAGVSIWKKYNKSQEEARKKLEALSDAITTTKDQASFIEDKFGVTLQRSALQMATPGAGPSNIQRRTEIESIKADEKFQESFGNTISAISGMNQQQAASALRFKGFELISQGMAPQQVQLLMDAIKEEAGKQNLTLDFGSVKVGTKMIDQMNKDLTKLLKDFDKKQAKGFETKLVGSGGGKGSYSVKQIKTMTKEFKAYLKNIGSAAGAQMNVISNAFNNGQITAEQFNKSTKSLFDTFKKSAPDAAGQTLLIKAALQQVNPELANSVTNVKDLGDRYLVLNAAMMGVVASAQQLAILSAADTALSNIATDGERNFAGSIQAGKASVRGDLERQMKAQQKAVEDYIKSLNKPTTTKETEKKELNLLQLIQNRTNAVKDQINAFTKLRIAGVDAATAMELASDPQMIEAAKKQGVGWTKAAQAAKNYANALKELALVQEAGQDIGDFTISDLERKKSFIELQEELIRINYSSELEKQNLELDKQQRQYDLLERQIRKVAEAEIAPLEKIIEANNYALESISIREEAINKKYDDQAAALEKIRSINEDIANLEKGRISLADALTRGDMAAAAQAMADIRQQRAAAKVSAQGNLLESSRNRELSLLGRAELEKQNRDLQFQILTIERNKVKPLQDQQNIIEGTINTLKDSIADIEYNISNAIQAISDKMKQAFGMTKSEIENAVSALNLAKNAGIDINDPNLLHKVLAVAKGDAGSLASLMDSLPAKFEAILEKIRNIREEILKLEGIDTDTTPGSAGGIGSGSIYDLTDTLINTELTGGNKLKIEEQIKNAGGTVTTPTMADFRKAEAASMAAYQQVLEEEANKKNRPGFKTAVVAMSSGGFVPRGTDIVPAMLTPGEFVVNRRAVSSNRGLLEAINSGRFGGIMRSTGIGNLSAPRYDIVSKTNNVYTPQSVLNQNYTNNTSQASSNQYSTNNSAVYNYSVTVNSSGSNTNANGIAKAVIDQIKYIDSQRVRVQ